MKTLRSRVAALLLLAASGGAAAGYVAECGSCHVAYPPAFLPPASWQRILAGLSTHYGTDASLDADTVKELSAWLAANGGSRKRGSARPPGDRITRSAWFVREHRKAPTRNAANCAACHPAAEQGDFNEHDVRIPR